MLYNLLVVVVQWYNEINHIFIHSRSKPL